MSLLNVANYLVHLAENNFRSANDITTSNAMFAAQQLFEILKSYRNSYFNELYSYETLDFSDEFDDLSNEERSNSEDENYDKNQHPEISSNFTVEEMENSVE